MKRKVKPAPPNSDNAREWEDYAKLLEKRLGKALEKWRQKHNTLLFERQFYRDVQTKLENRLKELNAWPIDIPKDSIPYALRKEVSDET